MTMILRGERAYYYRSVRREGRVVKVYCGSGPAAYLAAAQDARTRAKGVAERQETARILSRIDALAERIQGLAQEVDALLAAVLVGRGFHNHRGEWRKRLVQRTESQFPAARAVAL